VFGEMNKCPSAKSSLETFEFIARRLSVQYLELEDASEFALFRPSKSQSEIVDNIQIRSVLFNALMNSTPKSYYHNLGFDFSNFDFFSLSALDSMRKAARYLEVMEKSKAKLPGVGDILDARSEILFRDVFRNMHEEGLGGDHAAQSKLVRLVVAMKASSEYAFVHLWNPAILTKRITF